MKITVLIENSTPSDRFCAKHGLSLFVETQGRKILFDMGPDGSFIPNAQALGIDVAQADVAFVSHGHYDHGGGLPAYLELTGNLADAAPVYISQGAFAQHRARTPKGLKDIGIDAALQQNPQLRFTDRVERIDDMLTVFSHVDPVELAPESNAVLLEEVPDAPDGFAPDPFTHEQSLLIQEDGRTVLVSGCSHCGIVNIMKRAEEIAGGPLHAVVAGFHLMDPSSGKLGDKQVTRQVAEFMASRPTRYFTFHCTGMAAYSLLRDRLGDRVQYLYTGSTVEV